LPTRVDLKTGNIRVPVRGSGGTIPGGAATVLTLPLDPNKELRSLTVAALANDVVIGLLAATLVRCSESLTVQQASPSNLHQFPELWVPPACIFLFCRLRGSGES